jgi:hypothetical protein
MALVACSKDCRLAFANTPHSDLEHRLGRVNVGIKKGKVTRPKTHFCGLSNSPVFLKKKSESEIFELRWTENKILVSVSLKVESNSSPVFQGKISRLSTQKRGPQSQSGHANLPIGKFAQVPRHAEDAAAHAAACLVMIMTTG